MVPSDRFVKGSLLMHNVPVGQGKGGWHGTQHTHFENDLGVY